MDDLFQDTDEAGQAEESRSLAKTVTAAFQKIIEDRMEKTELERPSAAEPVREMSSTPTWSPAEMVEETITAFRKAARRTAKRRTEKSRENPPETRSTEDSAEDEPEKALDAEEEDEEKTDEPRTCSPEDLAPEFRRALSERGRAAEREASSAETSASEEASSYPPLPASFLWVTDSPTDTSAAISVEDLSAPRAQEAEAFLLRGGGKQPYRLLKRIRRHPEATIYLKPVFWRRTPGQQSPVAAHVDGTWTPETDRDALSALQEHATTINRRIRDLVETGGVEEGGVELRVLRFIATRDEEFAPRRTEGNEDEFVYPKLSPLLDEPSRREKSRGGEGELAQILWMTARRIRKK